MGKLERVRGRISVIPGATNDREVIERAVSGWRITRDGQDLYSLNTRSITCRGCNLRHTLRLASFQPLSSHSFGTTSAPTP